MKLQSLHELFVNELKDLYNAETQLTKALPKMATAACSDDLRLAFETHLVETKNQIKRLEEICAELDVSPKGKKCKAMMGLIEEGQDMIDQNAEDAARDAGLIAAAQRVEHYEMAGYATARTYAHLLGMNNAALLLQETIDEEAEADHKLTQLAESINVEANAPVKLASRAV